MTPESALQKMTLTDKFKLLTATGMNTSLAFEQLGVREMRFHDGPFGVRMPADAISEKESYENEVRSAFPSSADCPEVVSTAFPTGCALGATWDKTLLAELGLALGEEFSAYGINAVMGPAVNIKRHPLCGRNFEYLSEDPVLSGLLGAAYVEGVQQAGVAACPKHYIANNQERGRNWVSSEIDERTMREIYLKPFELIVKNARPWSIMCAYNRINGVYASEHRQLLNDILRDEWGFDGIVVSDWWAVKNRAYSLSATLDICLPYQGEALGELADAYDTGLINDEMVDAAVLRLLHFHARTQRVYQPSAIDFERHHTVALKAANKAMTLLKNENQRLPIRKEAVKTLLVIGECAAKPYIGGDGSSRVKNSPFLTTPLEEIRHIAGDGVTVEYMGHSDINAYGNEIGHMETALLPCAHRADAIIVFVSQDFSESSEAVDRNHIEIEPTYEHILRVCDRVGKRPVLVLNIGSALATRNWEKHADAILVSWLGGQAMGRAVAETLFGLNNPAGRLPETFPRKLDDVLSLDNYPGNGYVVPYNERMMVGYRHFDTNGVLPEYEFGFGLSYSVFKYSNIASDGLDIQFELLNDSDIDGEEVVQVYLSAPANAWASHPAKELKYFDRVHVEAHQQIIIRVKLCEDDFKYYNTALHAWVPETGTYTVHIGPSSRNLPLACSIEIQAGLPLTALAAD